MDIKPSRRQFLQVAGLAILPASLAACSSTPGASGSKATSTNSSSNSSGGQASAASSGTPAASAGSGGLQLPTFKEAQVPTPDFKGDGTGHVPNGYTKYPTTLTASVKEKPGAGHTFNVTTLTFSDPETNDNSFRKFINEQLGSTLTFQAVPAADYNAKVTALLAGGANIPQILVVPSWDRPKALDKAQKRFFRDLTPFLAGDKVLDYPNLASIPTSTWKLAVWNGGIGAVPIPGNAVGWNTNVRKDHLDAAGLQMPKDADSFYEACKKLTDKSKNKYALGPTFGVFNRMWGLTLGWFVDESGKVKTPWELDEFAQMLEYQLKFWKEGMVHPEVMSGTAGPGSAGLAAGKWSIYDGGIEEMRGLNTPGATPGAEASMKAVPMVPFAHNGGPTKVESYGGSSFQIFLSKQIPDDQVPEVLRILNFGHAAFGTKEYQDWRFGKEGVHFTMDNGAPKRTDLAKKENKQNNQYLAAHLPVITNYPNPGWVKEEFDFHTTLKGMAKENILQYVYVDMPSELSTADKRINDHIADILHGRKELSTWKPTITDWMKQNGEKIRSAYSTAYESVSKL